MSCVGYSERGIGDLPVLLDASKPGNAKSLKRAWMHDDNEKNDADDDDDMAEEEDGDGTKTVPSYKSGGLLIHMEEESLRKRKKLVRGTACLRQTEGLHFVHAGALTLPERASKHYQGSNRGTMLGPVKLDDYANEWTATVKEKKTIYGKRFRIAVGGRTTKGEAAVKRMDCDREPVFFNALPATFYEDLTHRFFASNVIDMTIGPGIFAEVCLKNRIGYFGIAFTDVHAQCVIKRLETAALRFMADETCTVLYEPKCAETIHGKQKKRKPNEGKPTPDPKKPKGKGKAKPKTKPKNPKPAAGEDDDDDDKSSDWSLDQEGEESEEGGKDDE